MSTKKIFDTIVKKEPITKGWSQNPVPAWYLRIGGVNINGCSTFRLE